MIARHLTEALQSKNRRNDYKKKSLRSGGEGGNTARHTRVVTDAAWSENIGRSDDAVDSRVAVL